MQPSHLRSRKTHRIAPGEYVVASGDAVISTLLGSCVAACLYDPGARILGMNHFLLSTRRFVGETPLNLTDAGRYGIHSMELLINAMMRQGARRDKLLAKAFGGAAIYSTPEEAGSFNRVGFMNENFIKEFLVNEGIPLVSADLGGEQGRVIYFDSIDYAVYVRKIAKWQTTVVAKRDHKWWEVSLRAQEKEKEDTAVNADIWL